MYFQNLEKVQFGWFVDILSLKILFSQVLVLLWPRCLVDGSKLTVTKFKLFYLMFWNSANFLFIQYMYRLAKFKCLSFFPYIYFQTIQQKNRSELLWSTNPSLIKHCILEQKLYLRPNFMEINTSKYTDWNPPFLFIKDMFYLSRNLISTWFLNL